MIGGIVCTGIGIQIMVPNGAAQQVAQLAGFIQVPGDDDLCTKQSYNLDVDVVQGNDIRLRLFVYDLDGGELFMDDFDDIVWNLRAGIDGPIAVQKRLNNGISVDDAINVDVNSASIDEIAGKYVHEFLLLKGGFLSTVIADRNLRYGNFTIRKKITAL